MGVYIPNLERLVEGTAVPVIRLLKLNCSGYRLCSCLYTVYIQGVMGIIITPKLHEGSPLYKDTSVTVA